jgi:hypothetical protein
MTLGIRIKCLYADCCCNERHVLFNVRLNVIILSVIILSVSILSVIILSVIILSVIILTVIMLNDIRLIVVAPYNTAELGL